MKEKAEWPQGIRLTCKLTDGQEETENFLENYSP
jgi:hypothetical protein